MFHGPIAQERLVSRNMSGWGMMFGVQAFVFVFETERQDVLCISLPLVCVVHLSGVCGMHAVTAPLREGRNE